MKILNDLLKANVLPVLQSGLIDADASLYGIVKPVRKTKDSVSFVEYDDDSKVCVGIHPDDKKDLWVAMFCDRILPEVEAEIGKKKRYSAVGKIELVGYSKTFRLACDYVVSQLSKVPHLTITEINEDSYKALTRLSESKSYNVQHDLFTISFDYTYKTDFCTVETLTGTEACANVY